MKSDKKSPQLIREREAAKRLDLSLSTLQRIRRSGRIDFVQMGPQARYTEEIIAEFIETCTIPRRPDGSTTGGAPAAIVGGSYEASLKALDGSKPGNGKRRSSSDRDSDDE